MLRRRFALALAVATFVAIFANPARAGALEDGKRLLDGKRYAPAADAFRQAVKAAAGSRAALLGHAKAVSEGTLGEEAYQEAVGLLRDRLRAAADDRLARLALAEVYLAWVPIDPRYRADAQEQFLKCAQADPKDADAAVGLARVYWVAGETVHALEVLDEYLGRFPGSAIANHGKGTILYADASNTYAAEKNFAAVKPLFERAAGAFEAATKADPKSKDSWLQFAYASQWLAGGDPAREAAAAEAYEKALSLDLDDQAPLRGLAALFGKKPDVFAKSLERLLKAHPKSPAILIAHADALKAAGKLDEAEAAYRAHIAVTKTPATGWAALGALFEQRGDAAGWKKAYETSIELDPDTPLSTWLGGKLMKALVDQTETAFDDTQKAHKLLDEYKALAALMPRSKEVRNNGGFFCREAYAKSGKRDAVLLKGSVDLYVACSELIPEYSGEFEMTIPYPERHVYAGFLNDTGLMFQYEPANLDLKKAESYYRRAMEWSKYGYWDAFDNLNKILQAQGRWKDAYDWAAACAEGIKKDTGEPNETLRATAAGVRDRLVVLHKADK